MLNEKEYFAEFPDEDPARQQVLLTAKLLATLRALEKELRPYIPQPAETGAEAEDPSG
jgi:hypothetical protein